MRLAGDEKSPLVLPREDDDKRLFPEGGGTPNRRQIIEMEFSQKKWRSEIQVKQQGLAGSRQLRARSWRLYSIRRSPRPHRSPHPLRGREL